MPKRPSAASGDVHVMLADADADTDTDGGSPPEDAALRRVLTVMDGFGVVTGIMIGSGIFSSPGTVVTEAGSPLVALLCWLGSAVLVLCGALTYAELGSMLPTSGGEYEFLRVAYGEAVGFAFTWTNFFVLKTGSQATISIVFGRYTYGLLSGVDVSTVTDLDDLPAVKALAMAMIWSLVFLNLTGIRNSSSVNNFLTALKFLLVFSLVCGGAWFVLAGVHVAGGAALAKPTSGDGTTWTGLFGALIACLWAFDGWADTLVRWPPGGVAVTWSPGRRRRRCRRPSRRASPRHPATPP